jgi:lipopolysaccharide transport system ATP-binding protein
MGEVAQGGRTVLFVSHNLTALRNLCTHGLYLEGGRLRLHGSVSDVLSQYTSHGTRTRSTVDLATPSELAARSLAVIRRASISPRPDADITRISTRTPFDVSVTVDVLEPDVEIGVFLICRDEQGDPVFSSGSFFEASLNGLRLPAGSHQFRCEVPAPLLNDGEYSLDVSLVHDRRDVLAAETSLLSFRVEEEALAVDGWHWRPVGVIRPDIHWQHEQAISG